MNWKLFLILMLQWIAVQFAFSQSSYYYGLIDAHEAVKNTPGY